MALKTVLVTGGAGLAAASIASAAPAGVRVIVTRPQPVQPAGQGNFASADWTDAEQAARLFDEYRFDAVAHCLEPSGRAGADHVQSTRNIVGLCSERGAYLVYVSGNEVFDGSAGPYGEDDPVSPVSAPGKLHVACEMLAVTGLEECAVARPSLMFGLAGTDCPAGMIMTALGAGKQLTLPEDLFDNPVSGRQFGEAVWRMLETRPWGAVHIAGRDSVSRHEFGLRVAAACGLDRTLLTPARGGNSKDTGTCAVNIALKTAKMEQELGIAASGLETALADLFPARPV
ncbi:MAG: sugar nucleotide-binding protein [Elusimicrobiaceae bacterium]|nr:sugar nucleotide-binding protein [Elusimicrobiaceae bacterium]